MTPSTADASRVLVACVWNPLVADDAVGPAVHGILSEGPLPEGVRVELLAVGGVRLFDELRGERALVVVDETPIGCFIEVEGELPVIHEAAAALGYASNDYVSESYAMLFFASGRNGDMVFA